MSDKSELVVFPLMSMSEFADFLDRAQEEYKKEHTLSKSFIKGNKGVDVTEKGNIFEAAANTIVELIKQNKSKE